MYKVTKHNTDNQDERDYGILSEDVETEDADEAIDKAIEMRGTEIARRFIEKVNSENDLSNVYDQYYKPADVMKVLNPAEWEARHEQFICDIHNSEKVKLETTGRAEIADLVITDKEDLEEDVA